MGNDFERVLYDGYAPAEVTLISTNRSRKDQQNHVFAMWWTGIVLAFVLSPLAVWLIMLFIPAAAALFDASFTPGYWAVYPPYLAALGIRTLWANP
jgi:hypothetical protein